MKTLMLTATLLLTIAVVSPGYAQTASYTIQDLGDMLRPTGINNSGQVTGFSIGFPRQAFIWQDGVKSSLKKFGEENIARNINDSGQIVGCAMTKDGTQHAVLWQNDVVLDLGEGGASIDINNSGMIIGWKSETAQWNSGVSTDFGTLGDAFLAVCSINSFGTVVGYAGIADGYVDPRGELRKYKRAFLWHDGKISDIGTLGGKQSYATCINDLGQVTGHSFVDDTYIHAFIWEDDVMADLGTLGGAYSEARSINDSCQIVGGSITADKKYHAFIWEAGTMVDLNTLIPPDSSWILREATAINDFGEIVGVGLLHDRLHGFLLTPTAETAGRRKFNLVLRQPYPAPTTGVLHMYGLSLLW